MASTQELTLWQKIAQGGFRDLVDSMTDEESIAVNYRYGTHNYKPLPVNLVRAENARVWDHAGNEYVDCIGSYSATAHGHLNPQVINALKEQLDHVAVVSRAFNNTEVGLFLQGICEFCELDRACPMNTGAEAVETAIKLTRKWGYTVKGVPMDKAEIICFEDNFHGRTTTIIGFSTEHAYTKYFGPYTPGFKIVPFGDIEALKAAITPNTVGILCEPIQAEGGILMPPDGWMTEVRELCDDNNVLLIWDEIQVGFYRTGDKFAWMHEKGAKPDIITVGKPLGGGILPVSAAVGKNHVMEVFEPGDHGSTFGGNPLAAAVALAALAEFETSDIPHRVKFLGEKAFTYLRGIDHPAIKEVRGRGFLIGIEVNDTVDSKALSAELTKNGILTKETRHRTFRLTPPLTIEDDLLMDALERVKKSILAVAG
ncbi:MAG: ornithine--oxo-acid transaminase [Fimbriimonadaceae bacterium]|nr:ornithine--oxo-acid transaminase [Fimbriimonadaceae bacterium]